MSVNSSIKPFPPAATVLRQWPLLIRCCLLAGLLAAEVLGLTIRFDSQSLSDSGVGWAQLLGHAPDMLRMGLAFIAAFLLIAGPRLKELLQDAWQGAGRHRWWPWLALHLPVFGGFYLCTSLIFQGDATAFSLPIVWLAGWTGLGAATFGLWLFALAPVRFWWGFVRRERPALLAAALAGLAAWGVGQIAREFWAPLAEATFWLSYEILGHIYDDVVYELSEMVLGTPSFAVSIAPECSGYEGIGLISVFLALYLWVFRKEMRFPQALLLFPIGALVIWLVNVVRITALIAIGTSFSRDVAAGGFHSQAGWIGFILVSLGLITATRHVRVFAAAAQTPSPRIAEHSNLAAAMLVPFLVLMGAMMFTAALSDGFDWLYPVKVLAVVAALWYFRGVYRKWSWRWSWPSVAIGMAVFAVWMVLEPAGEGSGMALETALADLPAGWAAVWLAFRVVGSVLMVPVVEELAFRGYLLRKLVARDFENVSPGQFTWLSFILSSVCFGLLHGRWLAGALAGMGFALALYRRGKLADAVAAHMTANALIAVAVLVYGEWSLWS